MHNYFFFQQKEQTNKQTNEWINCLKGSKWWKFDQKICKNKNKNFEFWIWYFSNPKFKSKIQNTKLWTKE